MKAILFTEEMFKAAIEGRKTQTRRIIPEKELSEDVIMKDDSIQKFLCECRAWYKKGDVVYLKEPYVPISETHGVIYKFLSKETYEGKFKNKLFMPAEYARYFIKINNVRVEQLMTISKKDSISEGIKIIKPNVYQNYINDKNILYSPIASFKSLWFKIYGQDLWFTNPWLFVYNFELIEKPG